MIKDLQKETEKNTLIVDSTEQQISMLQAQIKGQEYAVPTLKESGSHASQTQNDMGEDAAPQKLIPIEQIMKNFRHKVDHQYGESSIQEFDFSRYLKLEAIKKSA